MTIGKRPFESPSSAPIMADMSNIPVPPEGAEGEAPATAATTAAPEEVALLQFLNPLSMMTQAPLDFPFVNPATGEPVRHVTIRRLTFAQAMSLELAAQAEGRELRNIDLFAAMTGLPAAVIRGMERGDGVRVTDACLPFLPRSEPASASS